MFDVNVAYYIRSVHSGLHVAFFDTGSRRVFQQDVTPEPQSPLDTATRTFIFFPRPLDPNNPAAGICHYIANRHTGELATVMNASLDNAGLERNNSGSIVPQQPGSVVPWGYSHRGVEFDDHMRFTLVPIDPGAGVYLIQNVRSGRYWHIENAETGPGAYVGQWELPQPVPAWFKFRLEPTGAPVIPAGGELIPYFLLVDALRPPDRQVKESPYYRLQQTPFGSQVMLSPA